MLYEFAGYVSDVRDTECDLVLRDKTDQTRPDELWTVSLDKLPSMPDNGQFITVTIKDGTVTFALDTSVWTAEELADADRRADEMVKILWRP